MHSCTVEQCILITCRRRSPERAAHNPMLLFSRWRTQTTAPRRTKKQCALKPAVTLFTSQKHSAVCHLKTHSSQYFNSAQAVFMETEQVQTILKLFLCTVTKRHCVVISY